MRNFFLLPLLLLFVVARLSAQQTDLAKTIFHKDSLFWKAYNACDVEGMLRFISDDIEFYHDKGGVTYGKENFRASFEKNLCGNKDFRLRREAVSGSLHLFPLKSHDTIYGAILSGDHFFYINETGKKEFKDGLAKFTHLWVIKDGQWVMKRIYSYDHGPAPYINTRKAISPGAAVLKKYAGKYDGKENGTLIITSQANSLLLQAGNKKYILYPETATSFFVKERDLVFEFVLDEKKKAKKIIVRENGNITQEANVLP
ncbi:DUF4440 domain-containing protein [Nostoc ellipsosporum NOK]|nr:DUF4440 domain-containing protein [Nostoc ellipsosporum NOK]